MLAYEARMLLGLKEAPGFLWLGGNTAYTRIMTQKLIIVSTAKAARQPKGD